MEVTCWSSVMVSASTQALAHEGTRPIQIWVPDVRLPAFRSEAHRQSAYFMRPRYDRDRLPDRLGQAPPA
jgi:hypothetical protein